MFGATIRGFPAAPSPSSRGETDRSEHRTRPDSDESPRATTDAISIAVVDDDPVWLEWVQVGLEQRGYRVTSFHSGDALLESPVLASVDLVITDYGLPGLDGVELCEAIHAARPSIPTVLCTGQPRLEAAVAALRVGLSDYLVKPVSVADLDACIHRLLRDAHAPVKARHRARLRFESGKTIAGTQYRIDTWLGEGGMGTVYRGTNLAIERPVALKVLHSEYCRDADAVRNFRNEARASALIGADNIIDILDFVELRDGRLLIVMEYLDGRPLHALLGSEPLPLPRLIAVARQICRGLSAAHAAGIVHRDIKPDNVMLVSQGGREDFVKLIDFGIASFADECNGSIVAGTPQYMGPEIFMNGQVTPALDQYAVGCLLYELIAGRLPFDGEPVEVCEAQVDRAPPPLVARDEQPVPPGLGAIVERTLAKDPADRYASMDELEYALCCVQADLGIRTPYDDLPLPAVDAARREALARRMPRTEAERRSRWSTAWWSAGASAAAVALVLGMAARSDQATASAPAMSAASTEIQQHVEAATRAASRMLFVYPASSEPTSPTALTHVLALEAMEDQAATEAAHELRQDLAATLMRQGDRYWDYENGRGFASEFYAMALVFEPDDPHALERVSMTPGMLGEFRERAARADFGESELRAANVLRALAEEDGTAQEQQLDEVERDEAQSPLVVARVEQLQQERGRTRSQPARKTSGRSAASIPSFEDLPDHLAADDDTSRRSNPRRAERWVSRADRARRARRFDDAIRDYHRAIAADPRNLTALDGLASLYFDTADYPKAARFAKLAAQRGPQASERWLLLGDAYFKTLRYDDARRAYRQAKKLGSSHAGLRLAKLDDKLGR